MNLAQECYRPARNCVGHMLVFEVRLFCRQHNIPCHTTSGEGAYNIDGNTIAPDFAYKPTEMSNEYPDPVPPLWAVEIISPTDIATDLRNKLGEVPSSCHASIGNCGMSAALMCLFPVAY